MALGSVLLLGIGTAGVVARPRHVPGWLIPVIAVAIALTLGVTDLRRAGDALDPLVEPLAFLLAAVPLAAMLEAEGAFDAAAALATHRRHVVAGLWVLGIVSVAVLNLDAAVVLLTPLYVRVARRTGRDPVALAFQPVLLACLASSFLPVSNLTNLIAARRFDLGPLDFLAHLALPSIAAVTVGWFAYRRTFHLPTTDERAEVDPVEPDRRALRAGAAVLAVLVTGFLAGPAFGVQPWLVVVIVDVALMARRRETPWGSLPWQTAAVAAALAVLATAAAAHVPVTSWLGDGSAAGILQTAGVAALGANLVNNLPAFLVGAHHGLHGPGIWALLLGVNVGPTVLVTGTLAGLLWLDAVHRLGLRVGPREFARVGLRVGMPALAAATVVLIAVEALA